MSNLPPDMIYDLEQPPQEPKKQTSFLLVIFISSFVIFSLSAGIYYLFKSEVGIQPQVISDQWSPRKKIQHQWVQDAVKYSNQTNNEGIKAIAQFLNNNAIAAIPRPTSDQIELLEAPRNADNRYITAFVPLQQGDDKVSEYWNEMYHSDEALAYMATASAISPDGSRYAINHYIIVKSYEDWSEIMRATVTLHEGSHMLDRINESDQFWSKRGYCKSEQRAQEAGLGLLYGLQPEKFSILVQRHLPRYVQILKTKGLEALAKAGADSYDSEMDELFGKSTSELDMRTRVTCISIAASMKAIETVFRKNEWEDKKLQFFVFLVGDRFNERQK